MKAATAGGAALMVALSVPGAVSADGHPADLCLETTPGIVSDDEWAAAAAAIAETLSERTALFPSPVMVRDGSRLDISSGHLPEPELYASCLEPGFEWTARFDGAFLDAGADQMLAEAPTTPGIDSTVNVRFEPGESRVDTALHFAGPLDIPNGRCWLEERFSADGGTVVVEQEQGVRTSPFAEGACGRFFDHLPDGGAGGQAVTLLPSEVELPDGGRLRFVAAQVDVLDDALVVSGSLERGQPNDD